MKKNKYGIWGQLGPKDNVSDGQAIKTREFAACFKEKVAPCKTTIISTYNWKKNPLYFFIKTVALFINNNKIIIMPANNGFKTIVPLYNFMSRIFKRDIYYVVIGGFLANLLENKKKYLKMINKFKGIYVETKGMVSDLEKLGLSNVKYLPNFKNLNRVDSTTIKEYKGETFKLCSFSRITKSKGIIEAIESVIMCNKILGEPKVSIDFYGSIDETFKTTFETYLNKHEFLSYKGIVNYRETVSIMKEYYALIFPTYYHGEGFAGIIIDAFYSAIPIIATDWLYNKDLIVDGINGFLVPIHNSKILCEKILFLINNRLKQLEIRLNNYHEAERYSPSTIMEEFILSLKL